VSLEARIEVALGELDLALDLRVEVGEIAAIVGPNGAGKTTLLRCLAGLLELNAGRVVLGGRVLEDVAGGVFVPPEERRVSVVFQSGLLFPHLDARDNVAFGLRCRGLRAPAARRAAEDWLERVGASAFARLRPGALSGGQAQRVALARALAVEPALLLLDEPLSALDVKSRAELRRALKRSLDAFPGVRLLVTHDPLEAIALADRLIVLEAGRVTQSGTPIEVARRPRSPYAADLAGVNLLRGVGRGSVVELAGGGRVAVVDAGSGDVFVAIHPRAVALYRSAPAGTPRNVWPGTIADLDGDEARVRVWIEGPVSLVAEITPAAQAALELRRGDAVFASVKATEIAVYPA
jgi:molybdate transport system ATP-binding protein